MIDLKMVVACCCCIRRLLASTTTYIQYSQTDSQYVVRAQNPKWSWAWIITKDDISKTSIKVVSEW
jgi:hypothetical protein